MNKFKKLQERINLLQTNFSKNSKDPKVINDLIRLTAVIKEKEEYYNSIPDIIKTSNTLNKIIVSLSQSIDNVEHYTENKELDKKLSNLYKMSDGDDATTDDTNIITYAYFTQSKDLRTQLTDGKQKLDELQITINGLKHDITNLENKNKDITTNLENCTLKTKENENKIKNNEEKIAEYTTQLQECNMDKKELTNQKNKAVEDLAKANTDLEVSKNQIEKLDITINNNNTQITNLEKEIKEKIEESTAYELKNNTLITDLKHTLDECNIKNKNLEKESEKIEENAKLVSDHMTDMYITQIKDFDNAKSLNDNINKKLQDEKDILLADKERLKKIITDKNNEIQEINTKNTELDKEIIDLKLQIFNLNAKLKICNDNNKRLKNENQELTKNLNFSKDVTKIQTQVTRKNEDITNELQKKLDQLKISKEIADNNLLELTNEIAKTKETHNELENELRENHKAATFHERETSQLKIIHLQSIKGSLLNQIAGHKEKEVILKANYEACILDKENLIKFSLSASSNLAKLLTFRERYLSIVLPYYKCDPSIVTTQIDIRSKTNIKMLGYKNIISYLKRLLVDMEESEILTYHNTIDSDLKVQAENLKEKINKTIIFTEKLITSIQIKKVIISEGLTNDMISEKSCCIQ